jgi:hypothetical protein
MPVSPQFNFTELAAAGKQADLETERLQHKALRALSSCRARRRRRRRRHSSSEQRSRSRSIELYYSALRSWQACSRDFT